MLYVDAALLMSVSLIKVQLMLDLYTVFGCVYDLMFNAKLSALLIFSELNDIAFKVDIYVGGYRLQ